MATGGVGNFRDVRISNPPYEDLAIEKLYTLEHRTVVSVTHYFEQNGDLVPPRHGVSDRPSRVVASHPLSESADLHTRYGMA